MREVASDNAEIKDLHAAAEESEKDIQDRSIGWRANTVTATFSGAATVSINHLLGRIPSGWIISDITAAVTIHRSSWDENHISLTSSGACTVKVIVW